MQKNDSTLNDILSNSKTETKPSKIEQTANKKFKNWKDGKVAICLLRCNNFYFNKKYPCTSDKGGGATLVRLCLARVFFVRCSARLQLHLQQLNARRQSTPHLLSGGQQTVGSVGAILDFLVQHLSSRNLSRKDKDPRSFVRTHLWVKRFMTRLKICKKFASSRFFQNSQ